MAYARIDDEDYRLVSEFPTWRLHNHGYATCKKWINGVRKTILMHRIVMGVDDPAVHIDHSDHDRLNNQKHNLSAGSQAENNRNPSPYPRSDSSSIYKGVGRYRGGWRAQGWKDGKTVWIGKFKTEDDAHAAYREWKGSVQ